MSDALLYVSSCFLAVGVSLVYVAIAGLTNSIVMQLRLFDYADTGALFAAAWPVSCLGAVLWLCVVRPITRLFAQLFIFVFRATSSVRWSRPPRIPEAKIVPPGDKAKRGDY